MRSISPSVARDMLARGIRRAREKCGISPQEAAATLGWSKSKISRIESGTNPPNMADTEKLCQLYRIQGSECERLRNLAHWAPRKDWWNDLSVEEPYGRAIGLEELALELHMFSQADIPTLLQTREYTHALLKQTRPRSWRQEAKIVDNRQSLLDGDRTVLRVIVAEEVLLRPVGGPAVMHDQLEHLADRMERGDERFRLSVLSVDSGAHPAAEDNSFTLLELPYWVEPGTAVFLRSSTATALLEDPAVVARYTDLLDDLEARALGRQDSLAVIREISQRMGRRASDRPSGAPGHAPASHAPA